MEDDQIAFKPKLFDEREEEDEDGEIVSTGNFYPINFHFPDDKEQRQQAYIDNEIPPTIQKAIEASIERAKELTK
ncbi:hypothetical protein HY250_02770 [Candidatus Azambacteria bacterium]|nr:hypothetical protein [Candidatus Azambacteria bacterium]